MKPRQRRQPIHLVAALVMTAIAVPIVWWTVGRPQEVASVLLATRAQPLVKGEPTAKNSGVPNINSAFRASGDRPGASLQAARREGAPAPGAEPAPARTSAAGAGLLLVDGRVSPERISDASAAAILLPMFASSADTTTARARHRQAMLSEVGFSTDDARIVQRVLAALHLEVEEKRRMAAAARKAAEIEPTAANTALLKDAFADLNTPATIALATLRHELSPDGVARLRLQLERIKVNTKIYDR